MFFSIIGRAVAKVTVLSLFFALFAAFAIAQTSTPRTGEPPLLVGFAEFPPFMFRGTDGERTGLMVELALQIGSELGVDIVFSDYANAQDFVAAQRSGITEMAAGLARLPLLEGSNIFSSAVAIEELRPMVQDLTSDGNLLDKRIGIVPPAIGTDLIDLLDRNVRVDFAVPSAAVMALLTGEIDAVVAPNPVLFEIARRAGLDYRVTFLEPALTSFERVVALHESRANLMPDIEAAIAAIEDDGRLAALRYKYFLRLPDTLPDVLSVGVADFPPYSIQNEDGTFSGFGVEALAELANLAGLQLRFQAISDAEFAAGPSSDTYDMLPQVGITEDRRTRMDFTLPLIRLEFAFYVRKGELEGITDLASVRGYRVGVEAVNAGRRFAEAAGDLDVQVFEGRKTLLSALRSRDVDVIIFPTAAMDVEIRDQGLERDIERVVPAFTVIERAPALRRGLGVVRQRLNVVIPGYVLTEEFSGLREKYFGEPVFWTETRVAVLLWVLGLASLLGVLTSLFFKARLQRQSIEHQKSLLAAEKLHGNQLSKLVEELERSNHELDEFASVVSHDLKEPLRGISINTNFLMREDLPEQAESRIERINSLSVRMQQLISDMFHFSRLGRGDKALTCVDTKQVVEGVKRELAEWMDECNGKVKITDDLPNVHAERVKIGSLFNVLIVNGLKYNDADEKLVEVGFGNAEVNGNPFRDVFWVRDNGIGIEPKHYERIFQIFQRLHREEHYGAGSGAGLAFARKIVAGYGGEILVDSAPGEGTTFYFSLPLMRQGV